MIECLIIGDSIAVGTQHHRPQCERRAQGGINSADWNRRYLNGPQQARTVIISLGSNDWRSINTMHNLKILRENVEADRVFWILPAIKPERQAMIRKIAEVYGDTVLPIPEVSTDGVHPTGRGYRRLADMTK
jgi:hypothetical protein